MRWKIFVTIVVIAVLAVIGVSVYYSSSSGEKPSFQIDSVFLKNIIKANGSFDGSVRVTNNGDFSSFSVSSQGLDNFLLIEPKGFELNKGETKILKLLFSNKKNLPEGVYAGKLDVMVGRVESKIPIILEIESYDVLFDSNVAVYPNSKISAGDKINAEIKIFDLGRIGPTSVKINYAVQDFNGNTILSESENVAVSDNVLLTKSFVLPTNLKKGDYVFWVVLDYKGFFGTSSSLFAVGTGGGYSIDYKTWMYSAGFLALFLIVVFFIFYNIYSRDKCLEEIGRQYNEALIRQEEYLERKEKENEKYLETQEEILLNRKMFANVKKKRKHALVEIRRKRIEKVKELKKENKQDKLDNQIKKWKKQGYDTSVLDRKVKIPGVNDIRSQIKKWKKQGYDTSVLDRKVK